MQRIRNILGAGKSAIARIFGDRRWRKGIVAEDQSDEKRRRRSALLLGPRLLRGGAFCHAFGLAPLTLLLGPGFLLFRRHHRPNLLAGVHLDLLQLLLALVIGQRRVFFYRLELILGVFADRFHFFLLVVGQAQRRIVLRSIRVHPAASAVSAGSCTGRRGTGRSRRATLLRGSRKRKTANESERSNRKNQLIYFHESPLRAKWITRTFSHCCQYHALKPEGWESHSSPPDLTPGGLASDLWAAVSGVNRGKVVGVNGKSP